VVSLPEDVGLPEALVPKEELLIAFVVSLAPEFPAEPESACALPVLTGLLQADKANPAEINMIKLIFFIIRFIW